MAPAYSPLNAAGRNEVPFTYAKDESSRELHSIGLMLVLQYCQSGHAIVTKPAVSPFCTAPDNLRYEASASNLGREA